MSERIGDAVPLASAVRPGAGYDIGIGICTAIEACQVSVKLDSAMASKLIPGQPWRRSGTSLLYLDAGLCSQRKPPEVGAETYLGRERIGTRATASLDANGDGRLTIVKLQVLLDGLEPGPPPKPAKSGARKR
ncbi:hypothetical protein BH23PSE2_BH23PSE2_07140 [soil metagenome]